jgi:hypothetical protein
MSVRIAPQARQQFYYGGVPLSGGKIYAYAAGTTTAQNTYTDSSGGVANTNPIILDSQGFTPNGVYFTAGLTYKLVLKDSTGTTIWTEDNLSGINDTTVSLDQWASSGLTPTYVSATSFTLAGDQTTAFAPGRRLKFTVTAGTVYGTIYTSAYSSLTTVTMVMDSSGNLDSGLSAVSYGLLSSDNPSIPSTAQQTLASATTTILASARGQSLHISGTTTITGFGNAPSGMLRQVIFDGALTLTHNGTSLILPGAVNITTAAGDSGWFVSEGSGNWRCVSFMVKANPPKPYVSAAQTITAAGALTLAHGLGATPTVFQVILKCVSTELNYSVNDLVVCGNLADFSKNYGVSIVPDATNLNIRYAVGTTSDATFGIPNKTTGSVNSITNAKWNAIFYAWVQ